MNFTDGHLIECQKCGNWEEISVDHPRHKLQSFELEWHKNAEGSVSEMKCLECGSQFTLLWDQDGILR